MRDRIRELMDRHDLEERLIACGRTDQHGEEREGTGAADPPQAQPASPSQTSSPPSIRPVRRRPARRATAADTT
jgi:hypothetical protein